MRFVAIAVVLAAGCARQSEHLPAPTPGSGSVSEPAVAARVVADAAPAPTAAPTKLQNETCSPRRAKDPGPTKATRRQQLGPSPVADVKDACVKHADCRERGHGRCVHEDERETQSFGTKRTIPAHNECVYDDCTSDDECRRTGEYEPRAELVCTCAPERNTCTFANCRKDSDCPSPFTCGGWHYCHSAADACRDDAKDCKSGENCVYSWDVKHYICKHQVNVAPD
jgi:hypothetical protein